MRCPKESGRSRERAPRLLREALVLIALLVCGFASGFAPAHLSAAEADSRDAATQPQSVFKAGSAYADITPAHAMQNYNDQEIALKSGASPLRVQAIVCSDGASKAAVISIDCTFIGRETVLRIRDALQRRLGIAPDHVCVGATHTHACPATAASFITGTLPDPKYLDLIVTQIIAAAEQADARLQPARIAAASIPIPPFTACRRRLSPEGQVYFIGTEPDSAFEAENPIDDHMQFVLFEDLTGKPLGLIFDFPCHNNMVRSYFSADFFGCTGDALRAKLGDIGTVLQAAPSGDVIYRQPGGKRMYPSDRAAGKGIADAILAAIPETPRREVDQIRVASIVLEIPDRKYDPVDFVYDNGRGASQSARDLHERRYAPEEMAVRARGATVCEVEIQAIAFGPVALVTNPAELFSIYGVRIKEASPFAVTLVSELSNGYCGYVPTPEAFAHRGYETYRSVYTSRLEHNAGDRIAAESIKLLKSLVAP